MLPPVMVEMSSVTQKTPPMMLAEPAGRGPIREALAATNMGPPWGLSGSSVLR